MFLSTPNFNSSEIRRNLIINIQRETSQSSDVKLGHCGHFLPKCHCLNKCKLSATFLSLFSQSTCFHWCCFPQLSFCLNLDLELSSIALYYMAGLKGKGATEAVNRGEDVDLLQVMQAFTTWEMNQLIFLWNSSQNVLERIQESKTHVIKWICASRYISCP